MFVIFRNGSEERIINTDQINAIWEDKSSKQPRLDFFKSIKYPDPQGITSRYRRALKEHRLPTPGTISQFEGFVETDLLFECMKLSLDSAVATRGRSNEKVVERFYARNAGYEKNEKRKEERRMARKNKVLDAILRLEGYK